MPPRSAALITTLVGLVYIADVFFGHSTPLTPDVAIQLAVFVAVAAVTAYVASRVKLMGAEREALAGELRQVRLEAADVLRNIPTGIVTVDPEGRLLYTNPAAEAILGFRERDWRDRPIMPEFARVAPEFWAALTATARRGVRAMRVEAVVRRPDRTFPIGVTTTTLDGAPGEGPRVTAIFSDISDSKRLERLRLRTERLEAVAELSSSLAHEIKNPLASIRSSVEQLARASRANPDEKFLTSLIVRESDRLSRLLSEFLDFSRVRVTECRPLDLHQVAGAAIRLVREHPDCPADARIELLGGPTPMEGDEDLLHRVVSNLVLNAVQAAGKEARVTVRTGRPEPHQRAALHSHRRRRAGDPRHAAYPAQERGLRRHDGAGREGGARAAQGRRTRPRAHRHQDARRHGDRHPRGREGPGSRDAGHPDDGAGVAADRDPGGEPGRFPLRAEAVLQR